MIPDIHVYLLDDEKQKFFGEGPLRLLQAIELHGSLRKASQSMDMAYTKALGIMRHAEDTLGFPLTSKSIGGKGGGGSTLTPEAKAFLEKYIQYKKECHEANQKIYKKIFETP